MGSVATPYEHRTMSEELVNCQRYYYPYKSILAVGGVGRPWIPVQMFLNDSENHIKSSLRTRLTFLFLQLLFSYNFQPGNVHHKWLQLPFFLDFIL